MLSASPHSCSAYQGRGCYWGSVHIRDGGRTKGEKAGLSWGQAETGCTAGHWGVGKIHKVNVNSELKILRARHNRLEGLSISIYLNHVEWLNRCWERLSLEDGTLRKLVSHLPQAGQSWSCNMPVYMLITSYLPACSTLLWTPSPVSRQLLPW